MDWSAIAALPTVRARPDDLDLLELLQLGLIDPRVHLSPDGETALGEQPSMVLMDGERTPLARVDRAGGGVVISPLRPLAASVAPVPDDVKADCAVVVRRAPTLADLRRVESARAAGTIVWVLLIARADARGPMLQSAVRAVASSGEMVVPFPAPGADGMLAAQALPDTASIAAQVHADGFLDLDVDRPVGEREAAETLAARQRALALEIYPPEVLESTDAPRAVTAGTGAVVLFTGLSGSGKSTVARAVAARIHDVSSRRVTLLDGDEVRQFLSAGLGFDAEGRNQNVLRIGWVAALVAEHGGIALAAPIAPFSSARAEVRRMAEAAGAFLLVWVSTPLEVCEARDRKGLYARARAGEIPDFTGISSPYETPDDADVVLDTHTVDIGAAAAIVLAALERKLAL